jgi:hypothetical protein
MKTIPARFNPLTAEEARSLMEDAIALNDAFRLITHAAKAFDDSCTVEIKDVGRADRVQAILLTKGFAVINEPWNSVSTTGTTSFRRLTVYWEALEDEQDVAAAVNTTGCCAQQEVYDVAIGVTPKP